MRMYRFTIIFRDADPLSEHMVDALYEAGCDDCSLGWDGRRACADFAREADSLEAALATATANVHKAGCAVDHVEIDHADLPQAAESETSTPNAADSRKSESASNRAAAFVSKWRSRFPMPDVSEDKDPRLEYLLQKHVGKP